MASSSHQHLPDAVVRAVADILLHDECPGNRPLYLLRMCGVCKAWRDLACETPDELLLDGLCGVAPSSSKGTLAAFRKQNSELKRAAFEGAARVLRGYRRVELLGDCVRDEVLFRIAARNGARLTHVKIKNASHVTDRGLAAIVRAASGLQELDLEQMGPNFNGTCLPLLLASCPQLAVLRIEGAPAINWYSLRSYWWPIANKHAGAAAAAHPPAPPLPAPPAQQQQQQQAAAHWAPGPPAASAAAAPDAADAGEEAAAPAPAPAAAAAADNLSVEASSSSARILASPQDLLYGGFEQEEDQAAAHHHAHSRSISAAHLAPGLGGASAGLDGLQQLAAAGGGSTSSTSSSSTSAPGASSGGGGGGGHAPTPAAQTQQQQQQQRQEPVQHPHAHHGGPPLATAASSSHPHPHHPPRQQLHHPRQPQQQQQQHHHHHHPCADDVAEDDVPDSLSEDLQACCTLTDTAPGAGAAAAGACGPSSSRRSAAGAPGAQPGDRSSSPAPSRCSSQYCAQQQQRLAGGGGSAAPGPQHPRQPEAASVAPDAPPPPPPQQQQQGQEAAAAAAAAAWLQQPAAAMGHATPCPRHQRLRHLHIRFANLGAPPPRGGGPTAPSGWARCSLHDLLSRTSCVTALVLDGPSVNLEYAATACPDLQRVGYLVTSSEQLDAALWPLSMMPALRELLLEVASFMVGLDHLKVLGMLPLQELGLDSHTHKQAPDMPPRAYSQVDSEGVKALVDAICMRMRMRGEVSPFKLSLCGATSLKQEAISALLRLPILTGVDTSGCSKLSPMDRMRLVAKVKAGQGLLEGKQAQGGRGLQYQGVFY